MYYKVVASHGHGLYSSAIMKSPQWIASYRIGKKTLPRYVNSKLMVFDEFDLAVNFICCQFFGGKKAILECDVENPTPGLFIPRICTDMHLFWDTHHKQLKMSAESVEVAPLGTYFVDSVTPIREVEFNVL